MTDHVISGLIRRRRELTGAMFEHLAKADTLFSDIEALDRTLRMFDPDIELDVIPALQSRPKPDWAIRGEVARIIMDVLRGAGKPLPTDAIAAEVHKRRGLEGEPTTLHIKRVRKSLDRQRARGTLRAAHINGLLCWTGQ